jgi:nucleotide-binding universal stress UspA family protein
LAREVERGPHDLVIAGMPPRAVPDTAETLLRAGEHHVLLVPPGAMVPRHALICVQVGEPAKQDVLFAARLVRHLGARATVLTVLPARCSEHEVALGERFLAAAVRTLAALGIEAPTVLRRGRTFDEILKEIGRGRNDLLVLGSPAAGSVGETRLDGVVRDVLDAAPGLPVLIVRSSLAMPREETRIA